MLLMSASEAALAIGGKCGGTTPDQDDPGLVSILKLITPKVEKACGVDTLTRGVFIDKFRVADQSSGYVEKKVFRLTNGFLLVDDDENPLTITDPDEEVLSTVEDEDLEIDMNTRQGTVSINKWTRGDYLVEYTAGFEAPELPDPIPPGYDPDARVLIGIPDWMKNIVVMYLTQWYRAAFVNPRGVKEISYAAVSQAVDKMVHSAVYDHYQRRRMGCIWGDPA